MLFKGELPVVPDTHENWDGLAKHSFSIDGVVGLPGATARSRLSTK